MAVTKPRPIWMAATALFLSPWAATPADRPLTFEAGVEATNVSVTVSDARGRYVTGLGETDFAVFEDGVRQPVSLFMQESLPITMDILIDSSGSMESTLPIAREAARLLVAALGAGDRARVIAFNQRVNVLQDFTSDREALGRAIDRIEAGGSTALYTALYVSLREAEQAGAGELRRRAIVLLSDGEDTASQLRDDDVLGLARRGNVTVYAVGLQRAALPEPGSTVAGAAYFLAALARESGGLAQFPRRLDRLGDIYARIGQDLRSQYMLGYVPLRPADRTLRRISVLVPGRDDVVLRHRAAYYAGRQ